MMRHFLDNLDQAEGHHIAVTDDAGEWTYEELRDRAMRIAAALYDQHSSGNFLMLPATADRAFVATLLGVMYSGNTPIPIDPDLPQATRSYIREKSEAAAEIASWSDEAIESCEPLDRRDDSAAAMILFTSGTSGYPKGVIISQDNLCHSCAAISEYLDYRTHNSAAVTLPLHYSYALLSQVCCMLFVGGRIRLFVDLRNPIKFAKEVTSLGLETFCGVPSTYHGICMLHGLSPLSMPTVKVLCSAGAAMDRSKYKTIKEVFPNATLFNNYGMTEAAPRISYVRDDDPRFHTGTCGKAMPGVEFKVVDPESHTEVTDGTIGMLVLRGPNITSGYLNDPELTEAAFTKDGYLISGDLARIEDGYLYVSGRDDDIFNVGGEKVAPLEVEHVLNTHEAVEMSAVRGVPDEQRGHVPIAFVKLRRPVSREELTLHLEQELTPAKMPTRYVEVRSFPLTANGKLQRRLLDVDDEKHVIGELSNRVEAV